MPRRVYTIREGRVETRIVWSMEEWCREVPEEWTRVCGCVRCCDADKIPREWREVLERDGIIIIAVHHGVPYFATLRGDKVCLAPWPKQLYRGLA